MIGYTKDTPFQTAVEKYFERTGNVARYAIVPTGYVVPDDFENTRVVTNTQVVYLDHNPIKWELRK